MWVGFMNRITNHKSQITNGERGITIIETTVILSVLFILAGAMAPIVSESVNTARAVKARNDASMIAMGLINLQKDLGGDALSFGSVVGTLGQPLALPNVLVSEGADPEVDVADDDVETALALPVLASPSEQSAAMSGRARRAALRGERRKWRESRAGALDDHLRTNRHGYRYRRPGEYGGWNGPYVSAGIAGDPWGKKYMINSLFLDGSASAADADGNPRKAVFVVSAGADGVIDTPFEQPIVDARAYGDDIVIRIQ
jgi:type II secretory pathway pseudopilin PulG